MALLKQEEASSRKKYLRRKKKLRLTVIRESQKGHSGRIGLHCYLCTDIVKPYIKKRITCNDNSIVSLSQDSFTLNVNVVE